jgi:uncharacterized protein YndB with AHSA1/START domain
MRQATKERARKATPFGATDVRLQIPIAASPRQVWDAMVSDATKWWPADFYTGGDAATRRFIFEPRLSGRVYEDWGNGAGLVWFDVIGVDPPRSLLLRGQLFARYGGPATSLIEIRLEASDDGKTVFHLRDTTFGRISRELEANTRDGWIALFEDGLKRYVESKR